MQTVTIQQLIENKINLFTFDYPLFDINYKEHFEQMIIDNYMFREIGVETPAKFIHNLKTRLNQIMPYYNKLYKSDLLEQRILDNYDVTETFTKQTTDSGKVINSGSQTTITDNDNITKYSDTPQGRVNLNDTSHITTLNQVEDMGNANTVIDGDVTSNNNASESWTRTMKGNIGIQTDADAIEKYRNTLLKIDVMVLAELNDLFLGVYNI